MNSSLIPLLPLPESVIFGTFISVPSFFLYKVIRLGWIDQWSPNLADHWGRVESCLKTVFWAPVPRERFRVLSDTGNLNFNKFIQEQETLD